MRKRYLLIITILAVLFAGMLPARAGRDMTKTVDSLRNRLASHVTVRDSIRTLYHLFDLVSRPEKKEVAFTLLATAERAHYLKTQQDMLRQLIQLCSRDDSIRSLLLRKGEELPNGKGVRGTRIFLRIQDLAYTLLRMDEKERTKKISELIKSSDKAGNDDLYGQVEELGTLVSYIGSAVKGKLYEEYLEKYGKLIERLPKQEYALRNQYYTIMANTCTQLGEHAKAVEADRKLLGIIDEMEKDYHRRGRRFRDMNVARFVCYRRMLNNYPALSREEVNGIYGKISELAEQNSDIASEMEQSDRTRVYYLMANRKYAEALPLIQRELNDNNKISMAQRRIHIKFLEQASRATGNRELELQALRDYCRLLEESDSLNSERALQEFRISYDVQQLQEESRALQKSKSEERISSERLRILLLLGASLFILIVMCAFIRCLRPRR